MIHSLFYHVILVLKNGFLVIESRLEECFFDEVHWHHQLEFSLQRGVILSNGTILAFSKWIVVEVAEAQEAREVWDEACDA